jgi:hypothetical protein
MAPALTIGLNGTVGDLVEHDRIEGFTRRLDADMPEHVFAAIMLERVAVHEQLRDGLNGEEVVGVAGRVNLAVDGGERDAEDGGIGLAELRDVVGHLAANHPRHALMQIDEEIVDGSGRRRARILQQARRATRLVQSDPRRLNPRRPYQIVRCAHAQVLGSLAYDLGLGRRALNPQ